MKLNYTNNKSIIISLILIILIIFILLQRILYSNYINNNYNNSNNVSRLKEKFYTVIEPGSEDITVLQKNVIGETNVFSPNIYYDFKEQKEKTFNLDNYF
jgi:hypothetical protein